MNCGMISHVVLVVEQSNSLLINPDAELTKSETKELWLFYLLGKLKSEYSSQGGKWMS